ncbi:hypothetical protein HY638_03560 [Candidatus Woesearchaeota archaeon]|nr:hypothetical protein [Candidatus Woesearchaeota archaeon]
MGSEVFLRRNFPEHFNLSFDPVFSLRNYAEILNLICSHYHGTLPGVLKNKRVLHIGSGPGYFLGLISSCGGSAVGIEPYVSSNAIKAKIEDADIKGKFDIMVAQDVFVESVFFGDFEKVIGKLEPHLNGILIIDNRLEEDKVKGFLGFSGHLYGERVIYSATRR